MQFSARFALIYQLYSLLKRLEREEFQCFAIVVNWSIEGLVSPIGEALPLLRALGLEEETIDIVRLQDAIVHLVQGKQFTLHFGE